MKKKNLKAEIDALRSELYATQARVVAIEAQLTGPSPLPSFADWATPPVTTSRVENTTLKESDA